jgi:hypothetical protein
VVSPPLIEGRAEILPRLLAFRIDGKHVDSAASWRVKMIAAATAANDGENLVPARIRARRAKPEGCHIEVCRALSNLEAPYTKVRMLCSA